MGKGTLLIGFGANKPGNRDALIMNADKLKATGENVYYAFIGMDTPTIEEVLDKMCNDGIDDAVVIPFFMSTGDMSMKHIPRRLGISDSSGVFDIERGTAIKIRYTRVMGESPLISGVIDENIKNLGIYDANTGIMLLTYGSQLRYSSMMAQQNANRLGQKGYNNVLTAFMNYNEPSIRECAEFLVKRGADKIIVIPLFVSYDANVDQLIRLGLGMNQNPKDTSAMVMDKFIEITFMEPIGTDPKLTDVLQGIIREARASF